MIRFGPAGIPLSCKGRTLKDGIEDVHGLGLNAMEVQMVRVNVMPRSPDDETAGETLPAGGRTARARSHQARPTKPSSTLTTIPTTTT